MKAKYGIALLLDEAQKNKVIELKKRGITQKDIFVCGLEKICLTRTNKKR